MLVKFKFVATFVLSALVFVSTIQSSQADTYDFNSVGNSYTDSDGLTITVDSLDLVPKSGSTQLTIRYTQKNQTSDKKLDEGSFKLFFTDGTSEAQFGFFNSFFPGGQSQRSHTWEWLNTKQPWLIEWKADFFAKEPTSVNFKWKIGSAVPDSSVTPMPSSSPTPSQNQTPGAPTQGATKPYVSWGIRGSKVVVVIENAVGKKFTAAPTGQKTINEIVDSSPYEIVFNAYSGTVTKATLDGYGAIAIFVLSDEGISRNPSLAPKFSAVWIGQNLQVVGKNLALGSSVELLAGGQVVTQTTSTAKTLIWETSFSPQTFQLLVDDESALDVVPMKIFKNCASLWSTFDGGISKSAITQNKGAKSKKLQTVFPAGYKLNAKLDRDKDGIACER